MNSPHDLEDSIDLVSSSRIELDRMHAGDPTHHVDSAAIEPRDRPTRAVTRELLQNDFPSEA